MKKGITYSFVVHGASNSVPKQPKTMPHGPRGQSWRDLAMTEWYEKDIGKTSAKVSAIASTIPQLIQGNTPKSEHFWSYEKSLVDRGPEEHEFPKVVLYDFVYLKTFFSQTLLHVRGSWMCLHKTYVRRLDDQWTNTQLTQVTFKSEGEKARCLWRRSCTESTWRNCFFAGYIVGQWSRKHLDLMHCLGDIYILCHMYEN